MTTGADRRASRAATLRRRLTAPALLMVAAVGAFTVVGTVSPYREGHYPLCPTYALLGVYCPACGGLRAAHDLAHLDPAAAWGMNPLVVLAVPVALVAWVVWVRRRVAGRQAARLADAVRNRLWLSVAAVLVVFTVLRNTPALAPWLAPG